MNIIAVQLHIAKGDDKLSHYFMVKQITTASYVVTVNSKLYETVICGVERYV